MQFSSIASGSSGNCLFAGNDDTHLLIDAGISKKRIEEGLAHFAVDGRDIDAVLVTHEHSDHIKGLGVWSRKYHVPIYATYGTIKEIRKYSSLGKIDDSLFHVIRPDEDLIIGNMKIHPFSISHDAADPVSYRIQDASGRIGQVTDLGCYDNYILDSLRDCDLLYVEANHVLRMLETGPYPYMLKRRIAGNYGHLCNEAAGQMIGLLNNDRLRQVVLGHLSKANNFPDLALQAVKAELAERFMIREGDLEIRVASRDHSDDLISI
jgi:phosphoribosyl 1,2-cyclic phosphodiesterase